MFRTFLRLLASIFTLAATGTAAQLTATLHSRETTIVLQARDEAPSLISLRSGTLPPWSNNTSEPLIGSVEQNGQQIPLQWKLDRSESKVSSQQVSFVYRSSSPKLRLTWQWSARDQTGPIEHSIRIENLGSDTVWIPLQESFCFRFGVRADESLHQLYVDKGMGKPSAIGTHNNLVSTTYAWEGRSSTYARDNDEREIIPWFMIERASSYQDGWYVGIEFSGRVHLTVNRDDGFLSGSVGLDPDPGPFRTRIAPNESFEAPTVMVGGFSGGPDGLGNVLRPWVRRVLNNPATWNNPAYPMLVTNSWGSGMQVDEALAKRMVSDSTELGMEMVHLDAGWFRGVGDWYPNPTKFPHGLAVVAEEAHERGLKFGIWVNWAEAGIDTDVGALNLNDPKTQDWLVADVPAGWKPDEFVGRTIDIGAPAAKAYAQREVERLVTDFHLDMLEHDGYVVAKNCARTNHPHADSVPAQMSTVKGSGVAMPDTSNSTDVSYHSVRSYYDIYSHIRRNHPELMLEVCNDGGRMVDFGSASHGDYFSITDAYDPISNRQAFYDASHLLPAAMLEDYVQKWPTQTIASFRYMLRSGMMGWLTIMQDTSTWTTEQRSAAKADFALYKKELRPLIRDADLYHVSERPDGIHWDGIEYFNPKVGKGVLYAFRGSTQSEDQHAFMIQGIRPDREYRLRFQDGSSPGRTISGRKLLRDGVNVMLASPENSELIFIDDAGKSN